MSTHPKPFNDRAPSWDPESQASSGGALPPARVLSAFRSTVLDHYATQGRDLPWRRTRDPYRILVSEFMLQQTPVDRVLPVWSAWLDRWPRPSALAAAELGDVLRAWGRLGYPRRAQRLHATSVILRDHYDDEVPGDEESLRALPGVGHYTAAAISAFAFGRRSVVLDTNVRRVVTRAISGRATAPTHVTAVERALADELWPTDDVRSARWSAAVMELGALVCTSRVPDCDACPVSAQCAWLASGKPAADGPARRQPTYEGSDRQARGLVLGALRDSPTPVAVDELARACPDDEQRMRAIASLLDDGLIVRRGRRYSLPS